MGFKDRSDALQMRYVTAILDGRNVEWIWIAKQMMRIKLLTGPCKQERKLWTSEMALLLLSSWKFEEAPTVDRLLKVWFRFQKFLRFSGESTVVPANLSIVSLKKWWMLIGEECTDTFATIEECAKKLGAVKMGDVSKEEWGREIGVIRTGEARVGNVEAGAFVLRWLLQAQITDRPLQQVAGLVFRRVNGLRSGKNQMENVRGVVALTPAGLTLLSEHCLACWKERNGLVFEKKRAVASPRLVFLRAKVSVEAGWSRLRGEKRDRVRGKDELFMAKAMTALQEQEERERIVGRILNSCHDEALVFVPLLTPSLPSSSRPTLISPHRFCICTDTARSLRATEHQAIDSSNGDCVVVRIALVLSSDSSSCNR
ncbi:hypothetical protein R1flu_000834 [Riccia fluitans]|uniref:Uncharacterized protein n=1 Tax=Riccia fluitans TaxID=41844 RepID=A0ABD1Y5M7_9MARC